MIKIAMVSTIRPVTNYCCYLIQSIQENLKEDVELLVYTDRDKDNIDVPIKDVNLVWSKNVLFPFQVFRQTLRDHIDIIHIQHEINMFGSPITAIVFPLLLLLLRLLRPKIVVTVHAVVAKKDVDKEFVRIFSQKESYFKLLIPCVRFIMSFIYASICKLANKIIVHSNSLKQTLIFDYSAKENDVVVIPHGVPDKTTNKDNFYKLKDNQDYGWLKGTKDKKIILYFGYLVRRKGIEYLIDAFSSLSLKYPDYLLVLAGGTLQRDYVESLKHLVKDNGLSSKVIFTSFINKQEDLDLLFSRAEFVVFPSIRSIAASGPLAQAMYYGKAVIAAKTGVLREEIDDGVDGLLYEPHNIKSLESVLEKLIINHELRERLSLAIKNKAKIRSWTEISFKTIDVYKKCLKPNRKKIFLLGAYGYGNTGDEGLLQVMIDKFRGFDITVNSFNPELISNRFNIDSVSTFSIRDFKKRLITFIKSDVLIYGGGTLFIEYWRTLWSLFVLNLLGKIFRKKVIFLGIGVGKLRSKFLPRIAVNLSDVISLRDRESADILKGVGVNKKLHVTADPGFLLTPADSKCIDEIFTKEQIVTNNLLVAISPRTITELEYYEKYKQIIAQIADYIIQRYNAKIVFIPMHKNVANFKPTWLYNIWWYDEEVAKEIHNRIKNNSQSTVIKGYYIPKEVLGIIGRMKILIGSPLHALIYAAISNVPFIGMEYCAEDNSKISSFFKAMQEQEYLISNYNDDFCFDKFKFMVDNTFSNFDKRKDKIEKSVGFFKEKAESSFKLFTI